MNQYALQTALDNKNVAVLFWGQGEGVYRILVNSSTILIS